jgi:hypothetical protein
LGAWPLSPVLASWSALFELGKAIRGMIRTLRAKTDDRQFTRVIPFDLFTRENEPQFAIVAVFPLFALIVMISHYISKACPSASFPGLHAGEQRFLKLRS